MSLTRAVLFAALALAPWPGAALTCAPALPVFCANVHISCSGKTNVPTSVFVISDDDARLDFANGTVWPVSVNRTETGDVYRHEGTRDWVRVTAEGRFSQRVYLARGPVMAYGTCRAE